MSFALENLKEESHLFLFDVDFNLNANITMTELLYDVQSIFLFFSSFMFD